MDQDTSTQPQQPDNSTIDTPDNRKGTGFTNLSKYLNANQNTNLDSYLGNQIGQEGQNFQNNVNTNQNQFQTDLSNQNQNLQSNQSDINNVLSNFAPDQNFQTNQTGSTAGSLSDTPDMSQTGMGTQTTDPSAAYQAALSQYSPSASTVTNFQNYLNPTYSGPTGLGNYDQLRASAQNLSTMGNEYSANPQGLLSRYLSNGSPYTSGQQNFDSMFLGNGQNIRQNLGALRTITPGTVDNLNQGDTGAAAGLQQQQQDLSTNLRGRLGIDSTGNVIPDTNQAGAPNSGLLQQYDNTLNAQMVNNNTNQTNAYNSALNTFGQNSPSTWNSILNQYGVSPINYSGPFTEATPTSGGGPTGGMTHGGNTGTQQTLQDSGYWGVNPTAYLSQNTPATLLSSANPQQIAQLNALQQLAGVQQTYNDPNSVSQLGTYNGANNGLNFNSSAFNQNVLGQQNAYKAQETPIYQDIQNAINKSKTVGGQANAGQTLKTTTDADIDKLNAIRQQYGLAPVSNTFGQITDPNLGPIITPTTPPAGGGMTGPLL